MDRKLLELQAEVSEHREEVERNRLTNEMTLVDIIWAINRLEQNVGRNMSVLQDRSLVILDQQKSCANHDRLREKLLADIPRQNLASCKTLDQALLSLKSRIPDCVTPTSSPPPENPRLSPPPTTPRTSTTTTTPATSTSTTPLTTTTTTTPITATNIISQPTTTLNPKLPSYTSCRNVPNKVSGVYLIRVNTTSAPFKVYCEMEKFGGGWIVVQHRFNGSVDFYRDWEQYRDGFGEVNSEFWLGLERMHQLTIARPHEIVIEMKDFRGYYDYARYSAFEIGSESEKYNLKALGSYSGTAGESFSYNDEEQMFTTKDRDNDGYPGVNWAVRFKGAWWYSTSTKSNLNGPYTNVNSFPNANFWYNLKSSFQGLSFSRMMIREL
ncbi:fibrinogen-like protein A [Anopheles darlingi]|uniref:fibrinogen-like protein A n=1 Tax=Anopheles darlingi TaxID=43151 RepID=UPI00210035B5|nr:fibrinogen-like protein A [Anopheles darlingi]